jgi:hypothetical protein
MIKDMYMWEEWYKIIPQKEFSTMCRETYKKIIRRIEQAAVCNPRMISTGAVFLAIP